MDNKEKDSPQFPLSISMSDGKDRWFFIICKFHLFAYNRDIEYKQFYQDFLYQITSDLI